jgi:tetratricopeptide (TPR) repeat protein
VVGDDGTYCPFCRREILQGVEDDILRKARFYGARAAKKGLSNQEKEDALGLAFSELDKLLSAKDQQSRVLPLIVKAEIFRKVGEPRKAMVILRQVQQMYKDAKRNTDFMMSSLPKARKAGEMGNFKEVERLQREVEKIQEEGVLLLCGDSTEKSRLFEMRLQIAMVKGDFGDWGEALGLIEEIVNWGDVPSGSTGTSIIQRAKAGCEYIRCMMGMGHINKAIGFGEAFIERNRRILPDVYKYLALAYKAKGDIETAKVTMNRALLYMADEVIPWDEENKKAEFFELYEELGCLFPTVG